MITPHKPRDVLSALLSGVVDFFSVSSKKFRKEYCIEHLGLVDLQICFHASSKFRGLTSRYIVIVAFTDLIGSTLFLASGKDFLDDFLPI